MYLAEVEGKGGINAKLVAYSVSPQGKKIATFELTYHRYIHGEFMTHRLFSRNAMSSRAVPVAKMLDVIRQSPAIPIHWGKNQPGMQAREECEELVWIDWELGEEDAFGCRDTKEIYSTREEAWIHAANSASQIASSFNKAGYHKQIVNRLVEPFQMMKTVMTATELDNFFWLRLDEDAQPEIFEMTRCIRECLEKSEPELLYPGQWHTPYVSHTIAGADFVGDDTFGYAIFEPSSFEGGPGSYRTITLQEALAISSSCCAQVSYRNLDNTYDKAMAIYGRLLSGAKVHASPFEHQATPMEYVDIHTDYETDVIIQFFDGFLGGYTHVDSEGKFWSANFKGFIQHRQLLDNHNCTDYEAE